MRLFIDCTTSKKAVVSLFDTRGKVLASEEASEPLVAIDRLLKKTKIKLEDIGEITSHPGPGSFTGLRVGAACAQALNFALGRNVKSVELNYEWPIKTQKIKKAPKTNR
jgi:tRNA A37 threonylcarbamoyladenosine modification protein TsaB